MLRFTTVRSVRSINACGYGLRHQKRTAVNYGEEMSQEQKYREFWKNSLKGEQVNMKRWTTRFQMYFPCWVGVHIIYLTWNELNKMFAEEEAEETRKIKSLTSRPSWGAFN